jgi:hypothetical protein
MINDRKNNKFFIKIPIDFISDLNFCLKNHPPKFSFAYNIDYFFYIADKIIGLYSYQKFKNLKMVPISAIVIRTELGEHYRRYFDYLLKYKFIITDNQYIVGTKDQPGKCKCYGLDSKYLNSKLEKYEITKKPLFRKYLKWKKEKFGRMVNDNLLGHLYKMMQKFTIDINEIKKYLDEQVEKGVITRKNAELELLKCERINDKNDPYALFLVKDTYGRVHTNFTNISGYIRKNFLLIDGEKTTQIDIISCQPALLHTLFRDYLVTMLNEAEKQIDGKFYIAPYEVSYHKKDIRDKYVNNLNSYSGEHIYSTDFMPSIKLFGYKSYADLGEVIFEELDKYEKILKSGKLYEFFQNKWNSYFNENKTRKEIKKAWIHYVFSQVENKKTIFMKTIWEKEFPMLTKMLDHFKEDNYRALAHELQRRESNIIYKEICPKIDKNNLNYFTVHDCVAIKKSESEGISSIFEKVLKDKNILTGVSVC